MDEVQKWEQVQEILAEARRRAERQLEEIRLAQVHASNQLALARLQKLRGSALHWTRW